MEPFHVGDRVIVRTFVGGMAGVIGHVNQASQIGDPATYHVAVPGRPFGLLSIRHADLQPHPDDEVDLPFVVVV